MKKVKKIKRTCIVCNKEFYVYPSSLKKDGCLYCSRKCFFTDFWNKMRVSGNGGPAKDKTWKHTDEYCKRLSEARKGELNSQWKGGVSLNRSRYRRDFRHTAWKRRILKRDSYVCLECNKEFDISKLEAHHLKEYAKYPNQRYELDNGVTLCHDCHRSVHKNEYIINKAIRNYETFQTCEA